MQDANKPSREAVTLDDLQTKNYISLKVGESAEFTIGKIEKVKVEAEFALPKSKTEKHDYRYEVVTTDGKVLSVSGWTLWNAIKAAIKGVSDISGTKLSIIHTGHGLYEVKIID